MILRLCHPAAGIAAVASVCAIVSPAQTQDSPTPAGDSPRFEVASLKPSLPGGRGGIIRPMPGNQGYVGTNMPLRTYLMIAYTVRDTQISGAPSWFGNDLYDLNAKAEKPSTIGELHVMLQNLLADRCQLKIHKESKETSGFALVVDKAGVKLTEHDPNDKNYPPIGGAGPGKVQGINATMDLWALFISRALDRPVVDKTGLTAHYDFTFEFVPDRPPGADSSAPAPAPDGPSLAEALKLQLGLRLELTKTTSQQIVIDHVEKPSGN